MRKFTIYNAQFTIFSAVTLVFYILHFTFYIPVALAVDSTPSASVQQKLEELKKEIASKASQIKQNISQKLQNKVYVGKITAKTTRSLELETKLGKKSVVTNEDTITPKKPLKIDDKVAVLGDIDDLETLHAKKIVLLLQPKAGQPLAEKTIYWGKVITKDNLSLTLQTKENKNQVVSISKLKTQVKKQDFVIITAVKGKNDLLEASFIYIRK